MFLWCHVRHINPSKEHPERIKITDKKVAEKLDYDEIKFPMQENDFNKIEVKSNICTNVFGLKISWFFQFIFRIKNLKTSGRVAFNL